MDCQPDRYEALLILLSRPCHCVMQCPELDSTRRFTREYWDVSNANHVSKGMPMASCLEAGGKALTVAH